MGARGGPQTYMTILYFIIALGLLIFVHELGHFIIAKRQGICVEAFSLGFGPRLAGFKRGDTDYRISLLPLGGYVKMLGEDAGAENALDPRSFSAKGVWARAKVIAFGPIMNVFFCLLIMPIVFMIGRAEPKYLREPPLLMGVRADSPAAKAGLKEGDRILSVEGGEVKTWEELLNRVLLAPGSTLKLDIERDGSRTQSSVTVGELPELKGGYAGIEPMFFYGADAQVDRLKPQGPADLAGLREGDKILSYAGKPVADFMDLSEKVNAGGGAVAEIVVSRDKESVTLKVQPIFDKEYGRFVIGISKDRKTGMPIEIIRYGFIDAVVAGTKENIKLAGLTLDVLKRLVTLQLSYKVLGGPIIIAKVSAAAAASGLADFLYFLAFLSIQLAILNFLPIPVLDGGHLMFLGIEAIFRRPVSARVRSIADQTGFAILIALMLIVTYNDLESVWGIGTMVKKIF